MPKKKKTTSQKFKIGELVEIKNKAFSKANGKRGKIIEYREGQAFPYEVKFESPDSIKSLGVESAVFQEEEIIIALRMFSIFLVVLFMLINFYFHISTPPAQTKYLSINLRGSNIFNKKIEFPVKIQESI